MIKQEQMKHMFGKNEMGLSGHSNQVMKFWICILCWRFGCQRAFRSKI